jgi:hypothetical protein
VAVLLEAFEERLTEIDAYLELLADFEKQIQTGVPRFGVDGPVISATHQKILYSSVYLQLYNLIEATITKCVEAVSAAIAKDKWFPGDLSEDLRREWVRFIARTHVDLTSENRLESALALCQHLLQASPVGSLKIERGGGGNWDDEQIYRFAARLGCALTISQASEEAVKRPFRNELGALALIVKLRNDLAHGNVSFAECGDEITVTELRDLKVRTEGYLRDVVGSFGSFVDDYVFLIPERRPVLA